MGRQIVRPMFFFVTLLKCKDYTERDAAVEYIFALRGSIEIPPPTQTRTYRIYQKCFCAFAFETQQLYFSDSSTQSSEDTAFLKKEAFSDINMLQSSFFNKVILNLIQIAFS